MRMPQELHVIKCCNCDLFQVHIIKKVPKWECKVCGEKQSVKKVYGKGSGKECRLLVQQLNQKRLETASQQFTTPQYAEVPIFHLPSSQNVALPSNNSRWTEFTATTTATQAANPFFAEELEKSDLDSYAFERPAKQRKIKRNVENCNELNIKNTDTNTCLISTVENTSINSASNEKSTDNGYDSTSQQNIKESNCNTLEKNLNTKEMHFYDTCDHYKENTCTAEGENISKWTVFCNEKDENHTESDLYLNQSCLIATRNNALINKSLNSINMKADYENKLKVFNSSDDNIDNIFKF